MPFFSYRRHGFAVLAAVATLATLGFMGTGQAHTRPHKHRPPVQAEGFDVHRSDIVHFVDEVAGRDALDREDMLELLKKAHRMPAILTAMSAPAEAVVPWYEYRARVLTPERISEGVQFWQAHRAALERIAAAQEIPPQYLVAILGVETRFGRSTGNFRVLDALTTLAFDYPPRAPFFRDELEQFLLLTREERINPLTATGSYAGAMGAPQFLPSTYRRYAVDADGDHNKNLWSDWEDILASIAHFVKDHGWQAGAPVLTEVTVDPGVTVSVPEKLELNETVASLAAHGIKATDEIPGATPALVIPAETKDGPAYRMGFKNFYVITRYNRSVRYAMAVHDLAVAIAQQVHPGEHSP